MLAQLYRSFGKVQKLIVNECISPLNILTLGTVHFKYWVSNSNIFVYYISTLMPVPEPLTHFLEIMRKNKAKNSRLPVCLVKIKIK